MKTHEERIRELESEVSALRTSLTEMLEQIDHYRSAIADAESRLEDGDSYFWCVVLEGEP